MRREFDQVWTALKALAELPALVEELDRKVTALGARLDALGAPATPPDPSATVEQQVTQEQIEELDAKIEALKVLGSGAVSQAALVALEKRIMAKLQLLGKPADLLST